MNALLFLILSVIDILWWIIIISVIMSWLVAFNVINLQNQFVYSIYQVVNNITEPMMRPIRKFMPDLGGIDLSPIIVLVGLTVLRVFIARDLAPMMLG